MWPPFRRQHVMTELRASSIETESTRRSPRGLRRAGVSLVLALFVAIPWLAAHDSRLTQQLRTGELGDEAL